MRYVVCIKQVPVLARLAFDHDAKTIQRDGVPSEVSSFDVRALLKAVGLRDSIGGEVIVLTMGPPQASEAIEFCLALGADRGVHLCDPGFAGSDTLATARALAAAIRHEEADIVLLGRYSIDAETSQVGPEVAEILGWPQITAAHSLAVDAETRRVDAERETDAGYETVRATLPVVVTAAEDLAEERFPRKADREAAKSKPVRSVSIADLGVEPGRLGSAGSPTWVADLRKLESNRMARILEGDEPARELADLLVHQHGLFSSEWNLPTSAPAPTSGAPVVREAPSDLWFIVERHNDRIRDVSLEICAKLRSLADRAGGTVTAVALAQLSSSESQQLGAAGADRVVGAGETPPGILATTAILAGAIQRYSPGAVVFPATTFGRDVAPRLAARLGLGLTSDCIDLDWDESGRLAQLKSAFGGEIVAPILSHTVPELATVRPGVLPLPGGGQARQLPWERLPDMNDKSRERDVEVIGTRTVVDVGADLDGAAVVLGIGRGVGANGLERTESLRRLLGAALCTTRDVTEAGWLPKQYQVGLTGRAIAPKLYIGLAIRGAFEHMVGLRRAGIIVGINKNPKAPIFKAADYGIVGEVEVVVPALVERLESLRPGS